MKITEHEDHMEYSGGPDGMPMEGLLEALYILAYLTHKHGPFVIPDVPEMMRVLKVETKQKGFAMTKDLIRDENGKITGQRLFFAPIGTKNTDASAN